MEVLCNRSTKNVIKGKKYKVDFIDFSHNYGCLIIILSDFDFPFLVSNFSKLDSTEITINDEYKRYKYTDFSEVKIGDYIICRVNNFKTIKRGNYYRVENKKINNFGYVSIKFENIERWFSYSYYNFPSILLGEIRNTKINSLIYDNLTKITF